MSRILFSFCLLCAATAHAQDAGDGGGGASDGGVIADAAPPPPLEPPPPPPPPPKPAPDRAWVTPRVDVIGRGTRVLAHVPGTASVIKREDIRQQAPQSAGEALRTQPGVNVVPEGDGGMNLRLNVGIRGLDPNRSRKVLVLEDGMPVSLNPYGAPELYYSPPVERMDHIEVVKGSGSILWGPQTIGGVINYISRDPPRKLTLNADLRYGSFNYLLAQGGIGATHGPIGWRIDLIHRRFDGPRALDLALTDVSGKLRLQLTPRSILGIKLDFYDEFSRQTYTGLTSPQFELDPRLSLASYDNFVVRRYAVGVTHQHLFSDNLLLQTTAYGYETHRSWRRQEFDREDTGAPFERICDSMGRCGPRGATDISPDNLGGTIFFRNSSAIRNRSFWVAGVEPRLTWKWAAKRVLTGELTGLVRFHYERAKTAISITEFPTASTGSPNDDETRNGYALAAALQNRFTLWNKLHFTPGVRFENFWSDRQITRAVNKDVDVFGSAFSYAIIPGLGIAADVAGPLTLFAGVHRGYAPPRTQDAVSPSGQNLELDPELSWNTELGARLRLGQVLSVDLAGFHLEFENQIIPPSESGGAVSGGSFNAGHSRHTGLEAAVVFDFAPLINKEHVSFSMPLTVNYTYLPLAAFVGGLWGDNRLPYAPEHLLYTQLRFVHQVGFSAQVGLTYVSSQFADKENTPAASRDGTIGQIPGYALLDARVAYTIARAGLTLYISGKNLTNQVYVASRAPQGIQPAGFLQVFGGVEWQWQKAK